MDKITEILIEDDIEDDDEVGQLLGLRITVRERESSELKNEQENDNKPAYPASNDLTSISEK